MPTRLGPRYSPDYTGAPTALSREDLAIWRVWYPTVLPPPDGIYFNVGVGAGRPPPEHTPPDMVNYWLQVTQKRIDALLVYPGLVKLVELRASASPNALGRLLVYRALLEQDNPFNRPIHTVLVTDHLDPDLPALTAAHAIEYVVCPRPESLSET